MNKIFSSQFDEEKIKKLYNDVRNGLFHNGMSKSSMIFNNTFDEALQFQDDDIIKINPTKFLETIRDDFSSYIQELENSQNVTSRDNFTRIFTVLN